jgi:hypothetical protein
MAFISERPARGAAAGLPGALSFDGDTSSYLARNSASVQAKSRLKYLAQRLYALGPKPLFHLLDEVEGGAPLRAHLEEYASLPADFIKANRGDEFLPPFTIEGGAR